MGYRQIQQARVQQEFKDQRDEALGVLVGVMMVQTRMGNGQAANAIYEALSEENKKEVREFILAFTEGIKRFVEWCNDPLGLKAKTNGGAP